MCVCVCVCVCVCTQYDEYQDARVPNPADLATEDPPLPFVMGDQRLLNPAVLVGEPLERMFEGKSV